MLKKLDPRLEQEIRMSLLNVPFQWFIQHAMYLNLPFITLLPISPLFASLRLLQGYILCILHRLNKYFSPDG